MFENIYNRNKSEFELVCRGTAGNKLEPLLEYLSNSDFYYAPAAKSFHDNYPGGLYDHSKLLYSELYSLRAKMRKNWSDLEILLIAFGHDLCKVNLYEANIDQYEVITYSYNPLMSDKGHGTESLSILASLIPNLINERIAVSIVCHMGLWTKDIPNICEYMRESQTKDDIVFFTHSADMVASRIGKSASIVKLTDNKTDIIIG